MAYVRFLRSIMLATQILSFLLLRKSKDRIPNQESVKIETAAKAPLRLLFSSYVAGKYCVCVRRGRHLWGFFPMSILFFPRHQCVKEVGDNGGLFFLLLSSPECVVVASLGKHCPKVDADKRTPLQKKAAPKKDGFTKKYG